MDKPKTEKLIYKSCQEHGVANETLVFKKADEEGQGYIVIVFPGHKYPLPNPGSPFKVTYKLQYDGIYHGIKMEPMDPGAYD